MNVAKKKFPPLGAPLRSTGSLSEAVFLITGLTIGAGVLGLPYVIAQVGIRIGVGYILGLGLIMLLLNRLIGEVALAVGGNYQLGGLAGKYLSRGAAEFFNLTIVVRDSGVLLAYLIGEGAALQALFGGKAEWWSIVFWMIMSLVVAAGLERLKTVEKYISIGVISLLVGISLFVFGQFEPAYVAFTEVRNWLLPYGVILFALHASPAIIEAHSLMPDNPRRFRLAIVIGTLVPIAVYILFSVAVVGALGPKTTEIATVGLSQAFGPILSIVINVLAVLAMSTGFMGLATAFKETLVWDEKVPNLWALLVVLGIPLLLFLFGWRGFVTILGLVGGLFVSLEALILVTVYARINCQASGDRSYRWLGLVLPVAVAFICFGAVTVYQIGQRFF